MKGFVTVAAEPARRRQKFPDTTGVPPVVTFIALRKYPTISGGDSFIASFLRA
ncbi:MAG: hypothetical protein WEA04_02740 [Candidatus Andersenbacteria bacterium]